MSFVKAGVSWVRQSVAWSNSWQSQRARLILALFLAAAVGLGTLTMYLELWQAGVAWGVYLAAVTVCSRQGWLQLFGPVLFYDMVRSARRSRYVFMRLLYASLLLMILCMIFSTLESRMANNRRETAILAEQFFQFFMIVQIVMVVLLTPAYVAGAISEEKDRKTLEFMLATDLSNHEIVLSKLLSRLANMTLLLITGLPILSILQFLGGVDSQLMLAGFAGTALTMIGIASVSILFSTQFQKPRDSIGLTYLFLVAYGALATLGKSMDMASVRFMNEAVWFGETPVTLTDASRVVNAGNPIAAIIDIVIAMDRATLAADVPMLLTNYACFYGVLAPICILWSIARLRAIALAQSVGGTTKKIRWWDGYRTPVGALPMMWKELHIEGRTKLNWVAWGIVIVLVLLTIGSGFMVAGIYLWDSMLDVRNHWMNLSEEMNIWFRVAGTGVASLMLLMIAVRASTCISNERERDTFDALLTTPMSSETMLTAKLVGCLMSMRMGWLWFGSMMAVAIITGALHLFALPIIVVSWFVYATFFAMVGIWFSMTCRSSIRSTVYTVLTVLFLGGGHWFVLGMCCYFPMAMSMHGGDVGFLEFLWKFQFGLTPPCVIALYSYSWSDLARDFRHHEFPELLVFSMIGLFLWAMASLVMWYGILLPKFREVTRREGMIYR